MLERREFQNAEAIDLVIHLLQKCNIHPEIKLTTQNSSIVTMQSLAIDSIELLQFSMLLEDHLGVDLDGVQFAPEATIVEVVACIERLLSDKAG